MTDTLTATSATTATATATALGKSTSLSMNDFLKLMTTQLQAQDPFNPMDNTQMAAQLAQFSSVAGISQMNASLQGLTTEMSGSRIGNAAGLVGRNALVTATQVSALADGSFQGQITLPSAITSGTLSMIDSSGQVVHTAALGTQAAGTVPFSWDGKDANGNAVAGPLKLSVSATDGKGASVAATTASWATITGVQSPASGTTLLVTPTGTIDPAAALQLG